MYSTIIVYSYYLTGEEFMDCWCSLSSLPELFIVDFETPISSFIVLGILIRIVIGVSVDE